MKDKIEVFNYNSNKVRVVKDGKGEPWWVAKDVCDVLGLTNITESTKRLDDDEKARFSITDTSSSSRRTVPVVIVNEPGLYSLILQSRKPEAQAFKRWITHEVLPAIRKHGGYLTPAAQEEALLDPDFIIKLATNLKNERAARLKAEEEKAVMLPKAEFYDAVIDSGSAMPMNAAAKVLGDVQTPPLLRCEAL